MIRLLLLILIPSAVVSSDVAQRQYLVKADLFRGFKGSQYSIYDKSGKNLLYRMESGFKILQNVQLVTHPDKVVIGKLQARVKFFVYDGTFELWDRDTDERTTGTIKQSFKLLKDHWIIQWNGRRISMGAEGVSLTTSFFDEDNGHTLLAQFRRRLSSIFLDGTFDMDFFQEEIPDGVFLLSLAARNHVAQRRG